MTTQRFPYAVVFASVVALACLTMLFTAVTTGGISIFPLRAIIGLGGKGPHSGVFLRDDSPDEFYTLCLTYVVLAVVSLIYAWLQWQRRRSLEGTPK